jgi:ankyrin repeat protein
LSEAAEADDKAAVKLLLKHGAQPDFQDGYGCTPLSRAIEGRSTAVVELLLVQGAKVDYRYRVVSKFNGSTLVPMIGRLADTALLYYCRR